MSQANFRTISAVFVLCIAMLLTTNVDAQLSFHDSIVQAQKLVRGSMRQILSEELLLTEEENGAFWPLYDKYDQDMRRVADNYIAVVGEFIDRYQAGELTDDDADRLLDASFDNQMDALQIRQRYVRQFRKILPGVKVARFYQLESKVQAEVNAALALAIPLADPR
jgi:hypothetical protein